MEARELGGTAFVEQLKNMVQDIHDIKKQVAAFSTAAFPAGDADGHRKYHELIIRKTEEIRRLRVVITEKTLTALVWLAIIWLAKTLWQGGITAIVETMGRISK